MSTFIVWHTVSAGTTKLDNKVCKSRIYSQRLIVSEITKILCEEVICFGQWGPNN